MNLSTKLSRTIDRRWLETRHLAVGRVPPGRSTPDLFVKVLDADSPLLRIDVYTETAAGPFDDAIIWGDYVTVGVDSRVYFVDTQDDSVTTIELQSYFSGFYPTRGYLLIASGSELVRVSTSGGVVWRVSDLGIDGVVVERANDQEIVGRGEWDPPGDWQPFVLDAATGRLASGGRRRPSRS